MTIHSSCLTRDPGPRGPDPDLPGDGLDQREAEPFFALPRTGRLAARRSAMLSDALIILALVLGYATAFLVIFALGEQASRMTQGQACEIRTTRDPVTGRDMALPDGCRPPLRFSSGEAR